MYVDFLTYHLIRRKFHQPGAPISGARAQTNLM